MFFIFSRTPVLTFSIDAVFILSNQIEHIDQILQIDQIDQIHFDKPDPPFPPDDSPHGEIDQVDIDGSHDRKPWSRIGAVNDEMFSNKLNKRWNEVILHRRSKISVHNG